MPRSVRLVVLVVLMLAVGWTALTIVNAVTRSGGEGGVYWSAVGLLAVLGAGLLWLTGRVVRTRSRR